MTKRPSSTRVCYILSYRDPKYIRTRVLLKALEKNKTVELTKAINTSKSLLRYPQTICRLIYLRLTQNPQVYILGFRGHDIYWPVRLITAGKPLIFDEFINMDDWLVHENKKLAHDSVVARFLRWFVGSMLRTSQAILTDTMLDAKSSSETYGVSIEKYHTVYVGEDNAVFKPQKVTPKNKPFSVFFYGNMAPLHGVEYILKAAKKLRHVPFVIVGGKGNPETIEYIEQFITSNKLSNITYKQWVELSELPGLVADASICLGGPFGNTSQAKRVITGKTFQFLASGKPAIIGRVNEDVGFVDQENCLLVKQGSEAELVRAIEWAAKNQSKLSKIAQNGYRLFQDKFSITASSEKLDKIIKNTV